VCKNTFKLLLLNLCFSNFIIKRFCFIYLFYLFICYKEYKSIIYIILFLYNVFFKSDTNNCVPLPPPENGAIACDNWEGGAFCHTLCQQGTAMKSNTTGWLYVCTNTGDWNLPVSEIRPCKGITFLMICF